MSYEDSACLQYALRGTNLVISTIPGDAQLALIDAARRTPSIRRFIPSEFEGKLSSRPVHDPLDLRNIAGAITLLQSHRLPYTVLTCGLFYERFGPGGLGAYGMGAHCAGASSAFLVDIGAGAADVVERDRDGKDVVVVMTSMADVARYVAAMIEMAGVEGMRSWPQEVRVRGDAMTISTLLDVCQSVYRSE